MTEMLAPRADLIRMTSLELSRVRFERSDDDDSDILGTLEGYAAVFDVDTVIDSWEGKFMERIAPGAFKDTLKKNGERVKVLFNHGFDPSIGDKPLGKPETMEEDSTGLRVSVPLDDTSYNRDLVPLLRSGALDGQSFRFSVNREQWEEPEDEDKLPIRTLQALTLYEFGPVTFPAYEATTAGVRAREAYVAWRTVHPAVVDPDTADPHEAVVDPDTAPLVVALKARAKTISKTKEMLK